MEFINYRIAQATEPVTGFDILDHVVPRTSITRTLVGEVIQAIRNAGFTIIRSTAAQKDS